MSLFGNSVPINTPYLESSPGVPAKQVSNNSGLFSEDGPSFKDVLDSVNPLQQLPGVGMVYRAQTGDTISPVAKIAGGALFGGPIGAAISAVDSLVGMVTGSTVSDSLVAAVSSPAVAPPPVSQEVAQSLADQTMAKDAADKLAADEAAKARTQEVAAAHAALSRAAGVTSDTVDPKTISDTAATAALPLAQNAGQFVYARQERVYASEQLSEGLYKTASNAIKTDA